jgi:hypothetical protein
MPKPQTRQQARQQARHQAKQQARQHPKIAAAAATSAQARTRQEKKERARLQREAIRKQMARRRRARLWTLAGLALTAAAVVAILVVQNGGGGSTAAGPVNPRTLTGMQTGPPPWTNNTQDLDARIQKLGIPPLAAQESLAFHIHQHLDIFVDGDPVAVPSNIGITAAGEFAVLHTHDTSGVMHVESPEQRDFTLGDFFDVWGVLLTKNCLGGLCTNGTKTLSVYVNGTRVTTDPAQIVLKPHQEIFIAYGTAADLPKPIPKSYAFPAGE